MRNLQGKAIIITGASSGIGWATACACAEAGMLVTAAARRVDRLAALTEQLVAAGGSCQAVRCDVDSDEDVAGLIEASWERWGRLDAVFANAGYSLVKPVLDTPLDEIRAIFETNFLGTIRTLQAARPRLTATPDGLRHLLVCSSSAAEFAPPLYGVYAATKAAQDMVCGAMRAEVHAERLTVSSVHPVGTRTELFDAAQRSEAQAADPVLLNTPAMFMQTPEKVASAVVRCLRRPKPEVWPMPLTRFGLAITTAFPRISALTARRMMSKRP